ncbi:MAG TPA: patatin-like phospholipase family protein [Acidimicrobiia bacterium]|nr:patatin-like phospholipase family protein [Acidimicrobiia bacterium]
MVGSDRGEGLNVERRMAVMTLVFKAGHRRAETATKTAFVLSGGGNHGSAQVGMLRALLERGITPDVVIGTSAGALNGSAIAANPSLTGVDHLAEIWAALRTEHIFPGGRFGRAWSLLSGGDHLYSNAGLAGLIDQMAPASKFSQLVIPLRVVACDLATGEEVVLASGPLKPALLASSALPGSFPPVLHDHRTLVDGGVVDNVPLSHALAGPVDRIFVLNVSGGVADAPVRNPLDVVLRAFAIARNQRFERELALAPAHVDIVVLPRPADGRSPFDFSGAETIIDEAHILAGRFLDSRGAPDRHHPPRRRFRRAHAA